MTTRLQQPPAAVPESAKQAGDVRARWAWTEAAVWTDRMLTALEQGVKGEKWFSLIDKVANELNLFVSFCQVARNKGAAGVDRVTIDHFARHQAKHLKRLHKTIRDGSYRPHEVRRVWIPKPGSKDKRPLGIPTVGCKDALRVVDQLIKSGYVYVVDADLKSYFDTIPHDKLMARIRGKISDGRVLELIEKFLGQGVMEGLATWTPESGCPQGASALCYRISISIRWTTSWPMPA